MNIAITGGTGLVGSALTETLTSQGHHVFILTRDKNDKQNGDKTTYVEWLGENTQPEKELRDIDVFINLAGENLNSGRWTNAKKQEILQSRTDATREVVQLLKKLTPTPKTLINASAIGFYGTSLNETFTEETQQPGNDFLANVVNTWEQATDEVPDSVRVVFARFGMVLDKDDGALKKMLLPYQLFIGGRLGSGEQWISWIHIQDLVRAIIFCIEKPEMEGPVNMTAPEPLRMNEFGKILGEVIKRPHWAPVPGFLLKIVLGEMSILVIEGQRVLPAKLQGEGFTFQFNKLNTALENLLLTN